MTGNASISMIKKSIVVFVLLTFALSSISWFLLTGAIKTILLMWTPGIAALITAFIFFRSVHDFGWRPGKVKYLAIAFLFPFLTNIITYGILWLLGLGTYTGDWRTTITFYTVTPLFSLLLGLGEEIGWRGFLVPQLAKLTTFTGVALISGIIWALWHFPMTIMGLYVAETPLWWSLPIFFLGVITFSFVLAWLTIKSGSLWPAVILHGIDNYVTQKLFAPLAGGDMISYYVGESGIITLLVMLVFAIIFWMLRDRLPDLRIIKTDKPAG